MDHEAVHRIQKAVDAARHAARRAGLDNCDVGDIDEALTAVDQELAKPAPNQNTLTLYLNSVARSLIAAPIAADARNQIDHALKASGLPATWEQ
ncbi:MAG: hypothetical protein ACJ8R9_24865 [Steroidobacteraceae bacterium]